MCLIRHSYGFAFYEDLAYALECTMMSHSFYPCCFISTEVTLQFMQQQKLTGFRAWCPSAFYISFNGHGISQRSLSQKQTVQFPTSLILLSFISKHDLVATQPHRSYVQRIEMLS